MSIINKMLQDLDRRQGLSEPDATVAMPQVRTVRAARGDREWFWRIVAVLLVASVGWVAWIAWQLQPRESIATDLALKAAQSAPPRPACGEGAGCRGATVSWRCATAGPRGATAVTGRECLLQRLQPRK